MPKYKGIVLIESVDYLETEVEVEAHNQQEAAVLMLEKVKGTEDLDSLPWDTRDTSEWQIETLATDSVEEVVEEKYTILAKEK